MKEAGNRPNWVIIARYERFSAIPWTQSSREAAGLPRRLAARRRRVKVLREALAMDRNNLATWELLLRATNNVKEELHCLNRILAIDPNHAFAKRRLAALRSSSRGSPKQSSSRRKRQESLLLLLFLGSLVSILCVGIAGFALLRGGYTPFTFPNLTATAIAKRNASCQVLIDKAIQASGDYCDDTGSNNACYGNTTIKAELAPASARRFSERGDIVSINELRRISASPLNLENSEWGIAVFKLMANLPRSLPGETVTMVVFGNATLDNASGDSESLESFYFSSELGQIACEKVPFDGLVITSPDGNGIRFNINGSELTLMGTASVRAVRNGQMEVSVYRGSARIVSNGQEQYFGAGQSVSVALGGENGDQSVGVPSEPESLTQEELDIACTMTGQFCSQDEITPVSEDEAQGEIQSQITATPTLTLTPSRTPIPSATGIPTNTLLVLPTSTSSPRPTPIFTSTRTPAPTRTFTNTVPPAQTNTSTSTPTLTASSTATSTAPSTSTATASSTSTFTLTPTPTFTPTSTPTFTFTPTPTITPVGPNEQICTNVTLTNITLSGNELSMDITNNSGGDIFISRLIAYWEKSSPQQKLDRLFLDGVSIWNTSDNFSPSDFPLEGPSGNWPSPDTDRTILTGGTGNLLLQFQENLQLPYEVYIVFDIGCQVVTP
jgi:hypothetical protein